MKSRQKGQRSTRNSPGIVVYLFLAILLFAPIAFGTVELWSMTVVQAATCLLALVFLWFTWSGIFQVRDIPGALPLFLVLLWMGIQLFPLPPGLIYYLSPGSYEAYKPVLEVSDSSRWIPLTVNVKLTVYESIRISCYAIFYILTIQILANGKHLQKTVKVVVICSICLAFIAIIQRFSTPDLIYWFRAGPERARIMGPWINRSQFAGYMTMMLPLMLGLLLYYRPGGTDKLSLRTRVVEIFSAPGSNIRLLLGFGMIIVISSVLLSLSRGGILVMLSSFILFFFFLSRKKKLNFWPIVLIFTGGIALFFMNFGAEEMLQRFNDLFTEDGRLSLNRLELWQDVIAAAKVFWLTGSGFGTFIDVFPQFKTIPDDWIYDHAHNDYLELLTTGGIIAFLLTTWFVLEVLIRSWRDLRNRRDRFCIYLGIGALVGLISALLFGLSDFNMHNGAVGLYFFFLLGLLVSCGNTRFYYRRSATLLDEIRPWVSYFFGAIVVFTSAAVLFFPMRGQIARNAYAEVEKIYLSRQLSKDIIARLISKLQKISQLDPLEGTYWMVSGDIAKLQEKREKAMGYYIVASLKSPMRGEFLQRTALALPEDNAQSAELMELSYKRSLKKDVLMLNFAEWLLWRNDKSRAVTVLQRGLVNNPNLLRDASMLQDNFFSQEEIATILPPRVEPWIQFGDYLDRIGKTEESEFYRRKALEFVDFEMDVRSSWYNQLIQYYSRHKRYDEAAEVLRQAVARIPENSQFHVMLGDYYRKKGILYRAKQEYEQALLFAPHDETITARLKKLEIR